MTERGRRFLISQNTARPLGREEGEREREEGERERGERERGERGGGREGEGMRMLSIKVSHSQVHVVFHQSHSSVTRPTLPIIITHYVLIIGVRVLRQVALDEVTSFLCGKPVERGRGTVKPHPLEERGTNT